jgi:hypothetical protein
MDSNQLEDANEAFYRGRASRPKRTASREPDYVADTNQVREVDVFVDELDLGQLPHHAVRPHAR